MQHRTLLFRYVEFKRFGIEIFKDHEEIVLILRQPDKPTLCKTLLKHSKTGSQKGVNNLDTTFL